MGDSKGTVVPYNRQVYVMTSLSELRQDIVSGEWILVSTGRAQRPHQFAEEGEQDAKKALVNCPFEDPQKSGNGEPLLWYALNHDKNKKQKDWFVQVINNKFPALVPHEKNVCAEHRKSELYNSVDGIGYHEVIVTRPHDRSFGLMTTDEVLLAVQAYQARYIALKKDRCLEYILIFHNHRKSAGASLPHPHSQLIALPIIPPDIRRSFKGSEQFFKTYNSCVHCNLIGWEMEVKKRIVYENDEFVAIAPYASHSTYELRIYPKEHSSEFESITLTKAKSFASALVVVLGKLYKSLDNPAYNFFIHTAPVHTDRAIHYHWHLEIQPKVSIPAGLELGTGIDVVVVAPEDVPEILS